MLSEVCISSEADLEAHVRPLFAKFELAETEDSWEKIDSALQRFQCITKGGATRFESYLEVVREITPCLIRSLLSERTKLSGTASEVINSMAPRLGPRFRVFLSTYMPALLQLSARTNKVAMKRAEKTIQLICRYCHTDLILPFLSQALKDKATGLRIVAMSALITLVDACDPLRLGKRLADLEKILRERARDPNSEVRVLCRELYAQYASQWPERQARLLADMSPTSRRYLDSQNSSRLKSEPSSPIRNHISETLRATKSPSFHTFPKHERQVTNMNASAKPVSTLRINPTDQIHPDRSQAKMPEEAYPKTVVGQSTANDRYPKEVGSDAYSSNASTLADSDVSVPLKFSTPSEGVAYRLALAQEQARSQSLTGEARMRSRALLPSSKLGGARRIQVGKPQSSMSRTLNAKESLTSSNTSRSVLSTPRMRPTETSIKHATPDNAKSGTPTKSPCHTQFTPKRKPFGVVNEARIQSPERNNTVQ